MVIGVLSIIRARGRSSVTEAMGRKEEVPCLCEVELWNQFRVELLGATSVWGFAEEKLLVMMPIQLGGRILCIIVK